MKKQPRFSTLAPGTKIVSTRKSSLRDKDEVFTFLRLELGKVYVKEVNLPFLTSGWELYEEPKASLWSVMNKAFLIVVSFLYLACGTETAPVVPVTPVPSTQETMPVACEVFLSKQLPSVIHTKGDYTIGLSSVSLGIQMDSTKPFESLEDTSASGLVYNFSMRCSFLFEVSLPGKYKFFLESDDGSMLYVDGVKRVDNKGAHSMTVKTVVINFADVGLHNMIVLYSQEQGVKGLKLSVQYPNNNTTL